MWTEYGPGPPRRSAPSRWFAVFVALAILVSVAPNAFSQGPGDPPWRDAERAAADLADAQLTVLNARDALEAADRELQTTLLSVGVNQQDTLAIADELQQTQNRARSLAVEAYVTGGNLSGALFILDSTSANDFAFRSTLMNEGADALARSQEAYFDLRDQASDDAVALAEEMDRLRRGIKRAERQIENAERSLARAEWVMTVAEIHRSADELMERTGRIEPTEEQWADLRFCEARGDYATNTGNSFYGAYQFTVTTWLGVGGLGLPSDARPEEQDARARYLYALRGSGYQQGGSWPLCGRYLPRG